MYTTRRRFYLKKEYKSEVWVERFHFPQILSPLVIDLAVFHRGGKKCVRIENGTQEVKFVNGIKAPPTAGASPSLPQRQAPHRR